MSTSPYPVRLVGGEELERSRLTVFFRIFLLIPHVIVLCALRDRSRWSSRSSRGSPRSSRGACPTACTTSSRAISRYYARVIAYGTILADPFPPFGGGRRATRSTRDRPAGASRAGSTVFFRDLPRAPVPARALRAAEPALPRRDRLLVRRAVHGPRAGRPADARHVLPALHSSARTPTSPGQSALSGLRRDAGDAAGGQPRFRRFRSAQTHPSG